MSVRLKDIAEYLNVSVSTVSRVVNKKGGVSKETRGRVLKALEEFQYRPNEIARSLKNRISKTIGMIVPDISNYFYSSVIKGIESVASQNEYSVIVCNSNEDPKLEERYTELLLQKQISGLIIATVGGNMDFFKRYKKAGIPVVFIDNLPKLDENYDFVTIDNVKASYELTKHLLELGHKKIAIITGPLNETSAFERLKGWEKCLIEHNIPAKKEWIGVGDFKQESGYEIMKKFINSEEKPTAVVAANNFLAYGAIKAIFDSKMNIPDDIAVVCFDAVDPSGLVRPQITSIIQPAEDIGRMAMEIVIKKIQNTKLKVYEKIILEPTMVIGDSCGFKRKKQERRGNK